MFEAISRGGGRQLLFEDTQSEATSIYREGGVGVNCRELFKQNRLLVVT